MCVHGRVCMYLFHVTLYILRQLIIDNTETQQYAFYKINVASCECTCIKHDIIIQRITHSATDILHIKQAIYKLVVIQKFNNNICMSFQNGSQIKATSRVRVHRYLPQNSPHPPPPQPSPSVSSQLWVTIVVMKIICVGRAFMQVKRFIRGFIMHAHGSYRLSS